MTLARNIRMLGGLLCATLALAVPAAASDAIATGRSDAISLGVNWGPYETFKGSSFRWVDNDAGIVVHGTNGIARITIACEGGPGLGQTAFALRALDASRRQVDHVLCSGEHRPAQLLLPLTGSDARYVLHVDGGGRAVPGEKRILNFRVFALDDGRGGPGDGVVDSASGVRLGAHWLPIERFNGETFRWTDGNDAQILIASPTPLKTSLRLQVEIGPSVGANQTFVAVRDRAGRTLWRERVKGRQVVLVPIDLVAGDNEFRLSVASARKHVPHDPRILNLRLFSAAALR
jgi:hypothetical protein